MRRSNLLFKNPPRYHYSFKTWILTCLFRTPLFQINIQEPITLSYDNQGTRFAEFPTYSNDIRPIETGDHLITFYQDKAIHNMMMMAIYILFIDPTNTPVAEKQNNGKNTAEKEQEYIERATEKTPKNWAKVITDDINCFAIEEGVVEKEHLPFFKKGIEKHLPDWKLIGGTEFGLYFLVRKKYAEQYVVDQKLSKKLKKFKLDMRCLTLTGPTEKVSNIHVPHTNPKTNYKNMVSIILNDMIDQLNPTSDLVLLEITHIVSDKEHLKDGGTRRVSVSGITELTLRCGNTVISHKILGDFNLELRERQQLDQEAFSALSEKFTYEWAFKTISKNAKYIAGIFIGGTMTASTDFAAIDEAGAMATTILGSTTTFWEKANLSNIHSLRSAFLQHTPR